jgi:hypothetical protein
MANSLVNLFGSLALDATLVAVRNRLPASLGRKAEAGSLSVTLSSDGESIRLMDGAGTAITSTLIGGKQRLDVTLASSAAPGASAPSQANLMGGSDGTNLRSFLVDSSGRLLVIPRGPVSAGFTLTGQNPIPVGGSDGTNARFLLTDTSGRLIIVAAIAATDGSTTITTGGTAQNLFGGTTPVNGFSIYNPHASSDLWVSDSGTAAANAAGSIRVPANGGWYETPAGQKPLGVVSIVGATTGQPITARRW